MGILDRMSRLVRANVNDLLDRAEDPDKMIDQIIRDMQTNITDARRQVAAMIAQEKELEADLKQAQSLSNEWGEKAKRAVAAGKDDLAREALRRKRDSDEHMAVYQQQYATQEQTVDKLKAQLSQLESKYQSTLSQRDALIARQRRAVATKKVITQSSAAVSAMGEGLNAASELDRMEAKIRLTESEAAAYQEIEAESVDAQFRELDYDIDIESELEALKAGDSAPKGQLSAGGSAETSETDSTSTY